MIERVTTILEPSMIQPLKAPLKYVEIYNITDQRIALTMVEKEEGKFTVVIEGAVSKVI